MLDEIKSLRVELGGMVRSLLWRLEHAFNNGVNCVGGGTHEEVSSLPCYSRGSPGTFWSREAVSFVLIRCRRRTMRWVSNFQPSALLFQALQVPIFNLVMVARFTFERNGRFL